MTTNTEKDILKTISYNNPTTFSGLIGNQDYDVKITMADMARRIALDWEFDKRCQRNLEKRKNKYINKEVKNDYQVGL